MKRPVFIALDFPDALTARAFLDNFREITNKPAIKIGMELFFAEGPEFVRELRRQGFTIFLDLKLYDIPTTVGHAVASIAKLNVQYLTVHAAGGEKMLRQAVANKGQGMKLLAVTQLTSFSETDMQATQLTSSSMTENVIHLAELAYQSGIDGTISAPSEAGFIQQKTADSFLRVTPGIRLTGDSTDDQARITTPSKAREFGATGLVVGRSITKSNNPVAAYQRVLSEWSN
ncbi:orotidine-5'-phosphate decarboxylase [uncultured Leuconostoc sp.]|uniref:orotidine-5'-phosphate decarboxylase n=1 Tax=uncultured Leuconostoc sp. TaxID=173262 RepID=UPI0025DC45E7|nr:orotidine-5'-phosphate decarboxylase [uncultured Leuconostoc sp.]